MERQNYHELQVKSGEPADWTHTAKALLMQNTVCCQSKCSVCANIFELTSVSVKRQH